MNLSQELIHEFQKVHEQKFGEPISEGMARVELSSLAELLKIIMNEREVMHEQSH